MTCTRAVAQPGVKIPDVDAAPSHLLCVMVPVGGRNTFHSTFSSAALRRYHPPIFVRPMIAVGSAVTLPLTSIFTWA